MLLIGEDGANLINRSTPIAFIARGKYWVNNHAHVIDGISEQYLIYLSLFINAISLEPYVTGTAQPKMNQAKMNMIPMALPPLAEQQRIVERVDQLMALCDQLEQGCQQQLDNHQQLVDTLLAELTAAESSPDGQTLESELIPSGLFPSKQSTNPAWQRIHNQFDRLFSGAIQTSVRAENGRLGSGEALPNNQPVAQGSGPDSMDTQALPILPPDILVGTGNSDWAIDRLKETILQLAVMGRLVPQNESDEPASELLKRIEAEKAQLVKNGKIKKPAKLPPISDDEKPFQLPEGWEWVRIAAISDVGTGATPSRGNPAYYEPAEFNWLTSGETSNPFVSVTKEKISAKAVAETNVTICPVGTLVIAMYGQGKTRGQITELLIPAGTNQACATIQLFEKSPAHRTYIKRFFEKAYDDIRSLAEGGAQPNLNVGKVSTTVIPLPPLAEQQRIVERVDQLMALCDQLKAKQQDTNQTRQQLTEALVEQVLG